MRMNMGNKKFLIFYIFILLLISCEKIDKSKQEFEKALLGEWKGQGEHIYFSKNFLKYSMYKNNIWAISKWKIIKIDKTQNIIYVYFYDIKLSEYAIKINEKYGMPYSNLLKPVIYLYKFDRDKKKITIYKEKSNRVENILKYVSEKQKPEKN